MHLFQNLFNGRSLRWLSIQHLFCNFQQILPDFVHEWWHVVLVKDPLFQLIISANERLLQGTNLIDYTAN